MPAGAVADDPVEPLAQLVDHAPDALVGEGILVAGLRGGQQGQGVDAFVADERLRQLGDALHDVDEIVDDPSLGAEDEIEIAQADVKIDHRHHLSGLRQGCAEGRGGGRLADATLSGSHHDHL